MDAARRRQLLGGSTLGQAILRSEDRAGEAAFERAKQQVYERYPLSDERRQKLLGLTPWGRAVLKHEEELRQQR